MNIVGSSQNQCDPATKVYYIIRVHGEGGVDDDDDDDDDNDNDDNDGDGGDDDDEIMM